MDITHSYSNENGTYGYSLKLSGTATPLANVASFSTDLSGIWAEVGHTRFPSSAIGSALSRP